ncbi:MAG: sugar phosphate nucleotidyltransferase [bacterium]
MKVVLFCGGLGTRLREYSETIPKPLINIGYRPILWYIMKYYAYYGHNEFILCLGYRSDLIKEYFLNYNECDSNDFVLSDGGHRIHLFNTDIKDWKITFVDTGIQSNLGERLKAVEKYLDEDDVFLANYSDGLTDASLHHYLDHFYRNNSVACFLCVKPSQSFHAATVNDRGLVTGFRDVKYSDYRINGGFFVFKREIFDYMNEGEELVEQPFQRLIAEQKLAAYKYDGFWAAIDTFKDKYRIDEMYSRGYKPWEVWNSNNLEFRRLDENTRTTIDKSARVINEEGILLMNEAIIQ